MSIFSELSSTTRAIAAKVGPSVVSVGRNRRGAGIVVAAGQVLTNAHNLRDRTTQLTFADGRALQATIAGIDVDGDLAVLTVDTASAPPIEWAATDTAAGDVVFAVAPNRTGVRVTMGLVTTTGRPFRGPRGRRIDASIEHAAPLARGSSGGPLVDPEGRLVGVNTHRLGDGFSLALPASAQLRQQVERLARGESPERRRLGIAVASAQLTRRLRRAVGLADVGGLLVRGVEAGSPAERAGVQEGDVIVAAGGAPIDSTDALFAALDTTALSLDLTVVRGTEQRVVTVHFAPEH
ncbi:MAG TPA: trypsin-like peptidase domain-containing protein [Acidimicrobiales bacterium]